MTFCHSPHSLDPKLNPYPTEPSMHGCYFFTLRLVTPFYPFNFGSGGLGGVAQCHQSMYWMLLFFAKHGPQDRYSTHALSLVCAARTHPAIHAAMVGNMHRTCIEIQTATRHSFAILPRVRSCFGRTYIMIKLLQEVYCDGSNVMRRCMTV